MFATECAAENVNRAAARRFDANESSDAATELLHTGGGNGGINVEPQPAGESDPDIDEEGLNTEIAQLFTRTPRTNCSMVL